MPIDPTTLAEARALIAKAGMADFVPPSEAPVSTGGDPVAIALIDPPVRNPGVPNFDKPDPDRPGVVRSASILAALRDGIPLPPLLLFQRAGELRYELRRVSPLSPMCGIGIHPRACRGHGLEARRVLRIPRGWLRLARVTLT